MTNLEALQALVDVSNANLLAKVLADRSVTSSGTYSLAQQCGVELAAADVYLALATFAGLRQGSGYETWEAGALLAVRDALLRKWDARPVAVSVPRTSTGAALW